MSAAKTPIALWDTTKGKWYPNDFICSWPAQSAGAVEYTDGITAEG